MKKACTLKIASQLRDLTDYAAVRDNDTRWSSTYNMIQRFLKIKTELSTIVELLSLFPNHLEVEVLSRACNTMKKFDSVTVMLQRDGMTFVKSRDIFDLFLRDFPEFKHYIADDAAIVEDEVFERTVMRIARGLPLSEEERIAGLKLLRPDDPNVQTDEDTSFRDDAEDHLQGEESYSQALERQLKRQRRITESERSDCYINLDMLPGTSVNCERLFSAAKFILSDTRKRTSPTLFEALLLLKVNASYWNVVSVSQAMTRSRNTIDEDVTEDNVDEADDVDTSSPELASMSASSTTTSSGRMAESPSSVSISMPY